MYEDLHGVGHYNAGEIFWPALKENWAPYQTLRFMDWGHTNNSPNDLWEKRATVSYNTYGTARGVPYEIMIRLSNEMQRYPWFCVPHAADDNYVRKMAELVRDSLRSDLLIYVEHSNEVWNGVFGGQFNFCKGKGTAYRSGGSEFDGLVVYHAVRTAQIMDIWSEVLGRDRLIGVLAVGGPSSFMINKGMEYLRTSGKADMIDVAALAPYVGANVSYSSIDQAIAGLTGALPGLATTVTEVKGVADRFGLRLVGYEGGQHLWNFGQQFSKVGEDAQGDPRMYTFVKDYMRIWKQNGGDEFMVFASGGGFWGQIPWGVAPGNAPKYKGHLAFIQENPRWWDYPAVATINAPQHTPIQNNALKQKGAFFDLQGRAWINNSLGASASASGIKIERNTTASRLTLRAATAR